MLVAEQPYELDLAMLCVAKHTSLAELGRKLQPPATRSAVSKWANGDRPMPAGMLEQIAAILNEPVEVIKRCVAVGIARHAEHRKK